MPDDTFRPSDGPPICDYENSTYRTDFWEGRGREYEDAAERLAIRRLLPPRGGRLLDIGAGFGRLADLYAGYDEVVLLDYSRSQLEYARERLGDARYVYVAADIYHLPLVDAAVDTTVMVRVLHHLAEVPLAFGQIARVIRGGGTFLLEFANKRHLKNLLRYALRRGPNPFDRQPYEFAPLHFDFHPAWVAERLREAGMAPGERLSVSLLRHEFLKRRLPTDLLVRLDGVLQRPTAPLAPAPSVFVRSALPAGGEAAALPPREALLACPRCGVALESSPEADLCPACGGRWPLVNGIHVFK